VLHWLDQTSEGCIGGSLEKELEAERRLMLKLLEVEVY
jgi:hypothetical protein